ncbi:MBOAT family protein [Nitrosospira lacus]|uniref:Probable alginate O-acetylase AlgI n=1 Tax=Nitrosospira lacus TaxID=1288494 RepID=A0A1W6SL49_9PROT|nr:MBOAT family protein [Nitrosospira lacus]ARO86521.1 MBOAT family protein [Nitrosospira lacus]
MLFNSFAFIFGYLPVVVAVYFWLGRHNPTWAAGWLALASLVFYGYWDYRYIPLLLASIGFNYWVGLCIVQAVKPARKYWLVFAVTINLLLLAYFKYANFFLHTINTFGVTDFQPLDIILPIGISFYTFTQIAFLVDTYQGKVNEYRFIHYLLFVTYFPHLIAGPVLHHKEMMPQFADRKNYYPTGENITIGLSIFVIGLAKKILIADNIAPLANPVFSPDAHPQLIEAWIGALAYTFQLYFDFSAYSDMAIGLSRLFGVRLPLNFNSPYKAANISEFWRRWHMTLSRFLRDYLYIPLGGSRIGSFNRYRNLMATMLLGGLWHGAGWTFVIWGGLHGLYLVINHVWQFIASKTEIRTGVLWAIGSRLITFLAVLVAWVFFRAPDMRTAIDILGALVGLNGISLPRGFELYASWFQDLPVVPSFNGIQWIDFGGIGIPVLLSAMLIAWFAPNTQEIFYRYDPCLEKVPLPNSTISRYIPWSPSRIWSMVFALAFVACVLHMNRITEFLYFQF